MKHFDNTQDKPPIGSQPVHPAASVPANDTSLDPAVERRERRLRYSGLLLVLLLFVGWLSHLLLALQWQDQDCLN